PARTGGVPAAVAEAAEILAARGTRGQRARRQERLLRLHTHRRVRRGNRGLQRTGRGLTRTAPAGPPINRRATVTLRRNDSLPANVCRKRKTAEGAPRPVIVPASCGRVG